MNGFIQKRLAFLALPLAFALGACDEDDPTRVEDPLGTIVGVAQDAGSFATLVTALDAAGLTAALEGDGPFTVFAPTDDAFAAIDPETLNRLLADTEKLAAVLTYHVVAGRFAASDVAGLSSVPTLNGKALSISTDGGMVRVDGAMVTATDIEASNGIIHVIDSVLLPEPIEDIVELAESSGIFETLLTAVEAAGLTEALKGEGPFTVFAPTDQAFAAIDAEVLRDLVADPELLTAVLTYHVVPGLFLAEEVANTQAFTTLNGKELPGLVEEGVVRVGGATVVATDFLATNGVVHVIDAVLLPEPIQDIIQVAKGAGIFNTLLAAVDAAGLTDVLKGDGPFTVFAPTDEAFSTIPADDLAALLADPSALAAVLTYHVAPGAIQAQEVLERPTLTTVNGAEATISIDGDGVPRIDEAIITSTDIGARNGVIHIIDRVIFPD